PAVDTGLDGSAEERPLGQIRFADTGRIEIIQLAADAPRPEADPFTASVTSSFDPPVIAPPPPAETDTTRPPPPTPDNDTPPAPEQDFVFAITLDAMEAADGFTLFVHSGQPAASPPLPEPSGGSGGGDGNSGPTGSSAGSQHTDPSYNPPPV